MRISGIIILAAIPLGFGICLYIKGISRAKFSAEIYKLSVILKEQLRFSLKEVYELLDFFENQPQFSQKMRNILSKIKGENSLQAITDVLNSELKKEFKVYEIADFSHFFFYLGKSDLEGEIKHIEYYEKIFEDLSNKSNDDLLNKNKLYLSLFTALSLAVFVVLI